MTQLDNDELHAMAGDYVLGTLDASGRRAVEAAMPHDATLRAAVDDWQRRLLPLTGMVAPVAPGPALWQRIESTLAPVPARTQPARRAASASRWWDSLNLWRGLAAGGFAVTAIMALTLAPGLFQAPGQKLMVVLAAPQSMKPGWVIEARDGRSLRLVPLGDVAVPQQKSLQFWTKADGWKGPVSLGLVKPGQTLEVSLDKLPPLQPNQLFEITLEPEQGSPIDRPTGPILFIGRAVAI
jgi:anti-sigma-K factor RskA